MIELRPTETYAGVQPRPRILLTDHWIQFSNKFPDDLSHVKGKSARIARQQQVTYEVSYTLKEACYLDIDLSNEEGSGLRLYPNVDTTLYEMLIGFKLGNYLSHVYFPSDYPIYQLDYPGMTPLISDSAKKYLGAVKPTDSPMDNPIFKMYLVRKLKPVILRLYADDGVAYEKVTLQLLINRCVMDFQPVPSNVQPKYIPYLDEIKWIGAGT